MKRLALLLLSIAVAAPLFATAQAPDILRIDGRPYDFNANPLAPQELFEDDGALRMATWFTGNLIVPTGKLVDYAHMGYASTCSSYFVPAAAKDEPGGFRGRKRSGRLPNTPGHAPS